VILADIDRKARWHPLKKISDARHEVFFSEQNTNSVVHFKGSISCPIPPHLQPYLPLYCTVCHHHLSSPSFFLLPLEQ
jgi:hypothetical protein